MIPIPSGVRVWIATGHTDMRRGMQGLALQVQESLKRDPHAGDLYIFRGRRGDLAKILWHDGIGLSLYAKRLDRGKFIWPSASGDAVSISAAQMAYKASKLCQYREQLTRSNQFYWTQASAKSAEFCQCLRPMVRVPIYR
jgi:transposase